MIYLINYTFQRSKNIKSDVFVVEYLQSYFSLKADSCILHTLVSFEDVTDLYCTPLSIQMYLLCTEGMTDLHCTLSSVVMLCPLHTEQPPPCCRASGISSRFGYNNSWMKSTCQWVEPRKNYQEHKILFLKFELHK